MLRGLTLPTLQFTLNDTSFSARHNDVYHGSEGGPAQAYHISLGGSGLSSAQQGKRTFTAVGTSFSQGLNFPVM